MKFKTEKGYNPFWYPIDTLPIDGTFYLVSDKTGKIMWVVNVPLGCAIGVWFKDKKSGEWHGSSLPDDIVDQFTHWTFLPDYPGKVNWD